MANYPDDLQYTKDHEWIRINGDKGVVGITEYAQESLGDVVYVELPKVGENFNAHDPFGSVESVKAVSELYIPVSGEVLKTNEALTDKPELVNTDPYKDGWMVEIKITKKSDIDRLLSAAEYEDYLKEVKG
ncbi:MAG TPA: glycine cleavage system protein GcvH [Blastocatellia bacterium]|nr:glycine cleavage system protein GcvH [Blastocatellia bacterium]